MNEEIHNNEGNQQETVFVIAAVLVALIFIVGAYTLGYYLGTKNINAIDTVNTVVTEPSATIDIPETEATTECTTAPVTEPVTTEPVETSMPTEEETIPETVSEPSSAPETTEVVVEVDPDELEMLACVIYQEAGGDACCDDCRRRVADVVLNRVESEYFPDTIYEVLTAPRQYGRFHWTGVVWPAKASADSEKHAVERAYHIAEEVLSGQHSELYGGGWVWQAEFRQGTEQLKCCGIYFGR